MQRQCAFQRGATPRLSVPLSLPFPELIAEQQAAAAEPVEDVSNGPDLASERAQPALDGVFLASAHRQAVEDGDVAVLRGDEAAELGQHAGHADLLDEGGFSGAVGAEDELVRREGGEEEIVWNDGVGGSEGVYNGESGEKERQFCLKAII